ncbi:MAG: cation transporter, partial [Solirubrobacteraceae bacterium]|nr:cation transporter [Solirubrobacteraceae bacterium]
VVNLVAAIVALGVVHWASRPPDEDHAYGHDKADYFSAGFEGGLILLAAGSIGFAAVERLLNPQPVEAIAVGLAVTGVATVLNLVMARRLIEVGQRHDSVVLEADGKHLMTDVWTSIGVAIGVTAVVVTGLDWLDPVIALLVAVNILVTGTQLVRRSAGGLMDRALEPDELARIEAVLATFSSDEVQFHALRTRRAGRRAFVSVHLLVPGAWTVQRGHDLAEEVEAALDEALSGLSNIFTHLEPLDDPVSLEDIELDRLRSRG